MDGHTCWQVGFSRVPLPEQQLLRVVDVWNSIIPWRDPGEATCSAAIRHIPSYARYFVLRHGDHCALFHTSQIHQWPRIGHPLLFRLSASPCKCRSKTQLKFYQLDRAGLQCIVSSTVNLGLTIHTGWTCQLQAEQMEYTPLQLSMPSLLPKQLLKFRTRLAAGVRGNLSIHVNFFYFNAFSLSLFIMSKRINTLPCLCCSHCIVPLQTFFLSAIGFLS